MEVDCVILGGGAAGLWLLDALRRRGDRVLLLETGRLGAGQTVASQGILHGGLKYTLDGLLTPSAVGVREMPALWNRCLAGTSEPDLRGVRLRSKHCHLWRTETLSSRLAMMGAHFGLRVAPKTIEREQRPAVLADCPGPVAVLAEPVIAPDSLLATLEAANRQYILQVDSRRIQFQLDAGPRVRGITVSPPNSSRTFQIEPGRVVLAAGRGNAGLRRQLGLPALATQARPLHMVMARGPLPVLNGHCVDGSATRVTITSDRDREGRTVWQIGGQISEVGVKMSDRQLITCARAEIEAVVPKIDLQRVEWSTYRINRAEGATRDGRRPDTTQVIEEGKVLTAWPTKLALVPALSAKVLSLLEPRSCPGQQPFSGHADWPRPSIATPPYELSRKWIVAEPARSTMRKAA